MFLGPVFARENFLKLFADSIQTQNTVLKLPHVNEAALIADFFNADDYDLRKRWGWHTEEDYTEGYIVSTLLSYMEEDQASNNLMTLNIYDPTCSRQMGSLQFFASGKRQVPYAAFYLLPSTYSAALADEVHRAVVDRVSAAGLMYPPKPWSADILRTHFAKAADHCVTTERLAIRPYTPADNQELARYVSGTEFGWESNYDAKTIRDIETGHLSVGIFTRADQTLVGELNFWQIEDNLPRMSYQITAAHRGQGYASEAHKACIVWTDSVLPVPITRAEFVLGNHASQSVLKKSGFHNVGEIECDAPGLEGVRMIRMERPSP